jgi:hypothetical protein
MKNINVMKIGNMVKLSIDGKLQQKNCGSPEEASELFKQVLNAKENPTDENLKNIRMYLNEKLRVAYLAGRSDIVADPENGEVYLAGFNTPIPIDLVEVIKEYHEEGFPLTSIINFWKLLMINPDPRVRTSLFDFIKEHDFVLTDNGYMVVYKAVAYKEKANNDLPAFVSNQYLHVKKDWKCSPNKYVVYQKTSTKKYAITKVETAVNWNEKEMGIEFLGNLNDLFLSIFNDDNQATVYTDKHTKTMCIILGQPVIMERKECDGDPAVECSYGLHVGATKYVETFGKNDDAVLVCYINPANVVAVPDYDHSKMRVTEYFPFAVATFDGEKIDIIEQSYFESDYCTYEVKDLEAQIANVQANEKPFQTAINAEEEVRPMAELMKMLENRLVDIVYLAYGL